MIISLPENFCDHLITSEMLHSVGISIAAGSIALGSLTEMEHHLIKLELPREF